MRTDTNNEPYQRFNPLNDYLFFKVMGEKGDEKQLLGFLNAVLSRSGKRPIVSVEILERKSFVADIMSGKSCILDVRAVLLDGTKLTIEVQLRNEYNIARRSLYYWNKLYSADFHEGQDYSELPNVISINIINFEFPPEGRFHTCYHLREDIDPSLMLSSALEIHFINMVEWRKHGEKDIANDPLYRWLTWFDTRSPPELLVEVMNMDNAIMAANERQNIVTQNEEDYDLYWRRQMALSDMVSGLNGARREGEEKKAIEIAQKMKARNYPTDEITEVTGLSAEGIEKM